MYHSKPIDDLKLLPDHLNTESLLALVQNLLVRVTDLEKRVIRTPKIKKVPTQIGDYRLYVDEVLADGRIWSFYSIFEEIKLRWPELPSPKILGLQNACSRLAKRGLIEKVAQGNYRKKQ